METVGGTVESHLLPGYRGLEQEPLCCDVGRLGNPHSRRCLIVTSGVHGIEGFCGSAIQDELLNCGLLQPYLDSIQVLVVHAVNPFGFSHLRRVNEDNVDLNRAFVSRDRYTQRDLEYEAFRVEVFPCRWQGSQLQKIMHKLHRFSKTNGLGALQNLLTRGQYQYSEDPFFGGQERPWSWSLWQRICEDVQAHSDYVAHLDIHTGLGDYGSLEIIFAGQPESAELSLAQNWFGAEAVRAPGSSGSLSARVSGALGSHLTQFDVRVVPVGLEFGTQPLDTMLNALVADNWLTSNPDCDKGQAAHIKQEIEAVFVCRNPNWATEVWCEFRDRLLQALEGLTLW